MMVCKKVHSERESVPFGSLSKCAIWLSFLARETEGQGKTEWDL